jgi:hypothetical protein
MKVKRYSKFKMFGLWCLSILVNLLPLIVVLAVNYKFFITTQEESVALTITGIVWVVFLICSLIGSLPFRVNRCVVLVVFYGVLELMKPLLKYMCIFAGAVALGAILDTLIVRPIIKKYAELRQATKTADLTTMQVKQAVQELLEGRV